MSVAFAFVNRPPCASTIFAMAFLAAYTFSDTPMRSPIRRRHRACPRALLPGEFPLPGQVSVLQGWRAHCGSSTSHRAAGWCSDFARRLVHRTVFNVNNIAIAVNIGASYLPAHRHYFPIEASGANSLTPLEMAQAEK